ncbi:MAG: hypothetical protein C0490_03615 [Marivirga sp.]|nr:hypothetical protein [Marivirga sp.]
MKKIILSFLFLVALSITIKAQYNEKNLKLEPASAQYRFENLQLYPIYANRDFHTYHKDVASFVTLKEALEKRKIAITEQARGNVNSLFVENVSADTIMILAGEVVQGGKQDRMIAEDFILYPRSGKKDIAVFCVEHGRWQEKGSGRSFNEYFAISSNEVRKAGAVKKDQQEVWDKVSDNTKKNNAGSSSGTLAALKESGSFNTALKRYTDHFQTKLSKEPEVIGMVAVSGDRILGCDMFATNALFRKHYINLINSYSTEAITSGKPVEISYEKVKQYLHVIIGNEAIQEHEVKKNGTMLKVGEKRIHISTF